MGPACRSSIGGGGGVGSRQFQPPTPVCRAGGRLCPVHLAQVSFVIPAFNENFTLDLELNHHLLSSQYVERHFSREGTTQHNTGADDYCYYQGKLRGNPHSFAALSTCQGLHGVFSDGNFTYIVEPQEMAGPQEAPLVSPAQPMVVSFDGPAVLVPLAIVSSHLLPW
ncbi:disintegrin and metalloproteinase domain-containing protein 11-like [Tamandua tetradactyla]|uniref:disintegrin and metalloproteinase domain-containing protein 11-like n=1 Tax=Tamandua tetradactyla TaxID=48850 RepID=UPI0040547DE0